jgi:predicted phage terminase large subunit-like protein
MARNRRELAALQDELLTRAARRDLYTFIELAWRILEPATPFRSNWHVGLLAEYLTAVTRNQITRLVINIPPRYGKSLIVSVFWPIWEWIQFPSRRWLFVSHSDTLAHTHSLSRRHVIEDPWFRDRFPHVRLLKAQHAKAEFHNTRRGAMVALSMGGSITGKGGDRMIIDDPHSPDQAESDLQRQSTTDRFRITLSTRLNDKQHGAIVVVMQRLHVQDLSGVCLDLGFRHLCLPALAPRRTMIPLPISKTTLVREADEPLWPEREDRATLEGLRRTLGHYAFAGQYQQEPVPRSGGLFPREWWAYCHEAPTGPRTRIVQSWDLSFKGGDGSDFVVGLVAVVDGAMVYIIDRFKAKASFSDTCKAIKTMRARYPETAAILIEEAANGAAVIDTLQKEIPGVIAVTPEGGKVARAHAVQAQLEARQVVLLSPYSANGELRPDRLWVPDLVDVCAAFPKGAHDDDVDALTQLLVWLRKHPLVAPVSAVRQPEPFLKPRFGLYHDAFETRRPVSLASRARAFLALENGAGLARDGEAAIVREPKVHSPIEHSSEPEPVQTAVDLALPGQVESVESDPPAVVNNQPVVDRELLDGLGPGVTERNAEVPQLADTRTMGGEKASGELPLRIEPHGHDHSSPPGGNASPPTVSPYRRFHLRRR